MTLTQAAVLTKRTLLLSAIVLTVGLVSFISYKIWYAYYLAHLPPVEEKPDTKFGLLPPPDFPISTVSSSNFSYSLDTVTGSLPKLGVDKGFNKLVKVFFVTKPYASLLSSEKSQTLAEKFGITSDPQILSETKYLFKDQGKSLTVDLDSGNFKYAREASTTATPSATQTMDPENKLLGDFQNILNSLVGPRTELQGGRNKIIYLQKVQDNFIPVNKPSDAQYAQISLWPNSLDNKLIYSPDVNTSLVTAIVLNSANDIENYLNLNFASWVIDSTTNATYPAKTLEDAFAELKSGKGVIINQPQTGQISITSISEGYYLPEVYHPYLEPIYIFSGPQFTSYVGAIINQYINNGQ